MMLTGHMPYENDNIAKIVQMITTLDQPPNMDHDLEQVSDDAKDLIMQMLKKDPSNRPSAHLVLQHFWFSNSPRSSSGAKTGSALQVAADKLDKRRVAKMEGVLHLG